MLQDLTRSAIVVPGIAPWAATKPAAPVAAAAPDLEACSLDNLAALADLAYRAGDLALAEHCVHRLYALHDTKAATTNRTAVVRKARRQRRAEWVQDEAA